MTKVLIWNIEQFDAEKINSASNDTAENTGGLTKAQAAVQRRDLIYQTLNATQPDIFIIIEVIARKNQKSSTASNNGGLSGAVYLLDQLRSGNAPDTIKSADWRLVPPLWLQNETMAVFYRGTSGSTTRYFTGPNVWSGGFKGKTRLSGDVTPGAYAERVTSKNSPDINFNAMLVPPGTTARTIPSGALYNGTGAIMENTVAGRVAFSDGTNRSNFGGATSPLMVSFSEVEGGNVRRNITIFAVHPPANTVGQDAFMGTLAATTDVASALGDKETRLIGGDFNIPLLNENGEKTTRYGPLTDLGYGLLLDPVGAPPANVDAYRGYFATHNVTGPIDDLSQLQNSKLMWSASDTNQAYYPGYGYIGSELSNSSLDNILVKPKLASDAHNYKTTIMNMATGTPFDKVTDPAGSPPQGTIAQSTVIQNAPTEWQPWPKYPTAPIYSEAQALDLFSWRNYGKINSTSDHFAFYAEI